MAKKQAHYSGWIKRSELPKGYTGAVGVITTAGGHSVVQFAKPKRINEERLQRALTGAEGPAPARRGAGS